jgi:hypothetical protein
MRNKKGYFLFALARFGLLLTIFLSLLAAIAAIVSLNSNWGGRVSAGKNRWIQLSDFSRGIPCRVRFSAEFPDSTVLKKGRHSTLVENFDYDYRPPAEVFQDSIEYSNRIATVFTVYDRKGRIKEMRPNGKIESAVFYLNPTGSWDKFVLSVPRILPMLLLAFCCWQLYRILAAIYSGNSFIRASAKRMASIGWAILAVDLVFLVFDFFPNNIGTIGVSFISDIPNFRMPFQPGFGVDSMFRVDWLFLAAVILLLAKAFRYGNELQNYEDSTI